MVFFDSRLWQFTKGVRRRIAGAVMIGLLAAALGIARLALLGPRWDPQPVGALAVLDLEGSAFMGTEASLIRVPRTLDNVAHFDRG